ncbi:ALF repeat-containing protein [Streptomyces thioluteus]|uniref:ALF repeat-containing protein n=1 Tax=Streptomyces thioluteus TaxID=66431 RepID=UPI0031F02D7C
MAVRGVGIKEAAERALLGTDDDVRSFSPTGRHPVRRPMRSTPAASSTWAARGFGKQRRRHSQGSR